jgi:hypothetical protein
VLTCDVIAAKLPPVTAGPYTWTPTSTTVLSRKGPKQPERWQRRRSLDNGQEIGVTILRKSRGHKNGTKEARERLYTTVGGGG